MDGRQGEGGGEGVFAATDGESLREQGLALSQILLMHPASFRLPELVRELTHDSDRHSDRDRVERAVRELVGAGLLFRCEGMVLPTRAALCFKEILESGESIW